MSEIRWAWRNIIARRWRAALTVGLLALALAATTIVFSAADSLVFVASHTLQPTGWSRSTRVMRSLEDPAAASRPRLCSMSGEGRLICFSAFTGTYTKPSFSLAVGSPSSCRPPM